MHSKLFVPQPFPAAVLRLDLAGRIVAASRQAEELTGAAAGALVGRLAAEVFAGPAETPDLLACCLQAAEGKMACNLLLLLGEPGDRDSRSLLATILPLPGPGRKIEGALLCLRDAGEPDQIPRQILSSMADGVFTVDRNWVITSFNRAAEAITGWTADQAIGQQCSTVFHASVCGKSCAIAESLYTGRSVTNRSITIQGRDGKMIPVSTSAAPLVDHAGNIIGGVETFRDLSALASQPSRLRQKCSLENMVSKNQVMQRLFALIPEIAASPSTVLICGESGTGKELIARALYTISDRKGMPFVALNCGALPEALLESELFGYKAGAFTDARKDKQGRFAAAEGGVLFLDEIGEIPQSIQVKLLRVLQEKDYEPLGSNTPVKTDVRIITATNRDLLTLVQEGRFREDLYYRLNVVRIQLPPLRERKEDIPLLIDQFIREFSARQGKDIVGIATPALNILIPHDFPGNIRELKNIIEYAFILCDGAYILPQHLPEPFNGAIPAPAAETDASPEQPRTLAEIEKQAIYLALEKNRWKKSATCEELGISKDTLRRKLTRYQLAHPLLDDPQDLD